jgi:hypothetical protein
MCYMKSQSLIVNTMLTWSMDWQYCGNCIPWISGSVCLLLRSSSAFQAPGISVPCRDLVFGC